MCQGAEISMVRGCGSLPEVHLLHPLFLVPLIASYHWCHETQTLALTSFSGLPAHAVSHLCPQELSRASRCTNQWWFWASRHSKLLCWMIVQSRDSCFFSVLARLKLPFREVVCFLRWQPTCRLSRRSLSISNGHATV